jgi:hypothetical protein
MFERGTRSVSGKVRRCGGEGRITLIDMCIRRMKCRMARQGEREEGREGNGRETRRRTLMHTAYASRAGAKLFVPEFKFRVKHRVLFFPFRARGSKRTRE